MSKHQRINQRPRKKRRGKKGQVGIVYIEAFCVENEIVREREFRKLLRHKGFRNGSGNSDR